MDSPQNGPTSLQFSSEKSESTENELIIWSQGSTAIDQHNGQTVYTVHPGLSDNPLCSRGSTKKKKPGETLAVKADPLHPDPLKPK